MLLMSHRGRSYIMVSDAPRLSSNLRHLQIVTCTTNRNHKEVPWFMALSKDSWAP
jgi:hypothetical protein